jgi:hypothetical protein
MSNRVEVNSSPAISPLILWHERESHWQRVEVSSAVTLRSETPDVMDAASQPDVLLADAALAAPIAASDGAIGVLLVRDETAESVSVNGIPVPSGLHLLRHADRLDVADRVYWVSAAPRVEEAAYDPAVHGPDVFCYLTKARLHPAQRIKICPGLPGQACGAIYKAEAWEMAMQSEPPMPCASCGYHTRRAEWQPPSVRVQISLADRFRALFATQSV